MRTKDTTQDELFCTISIENLIPEKHPLRALRKVADAVLHRMGPVFEKMYSHTGRPCIPPEQLLRALLAKALYGFRSERRLVDELRYNLALRWFVGLSLSQEPWEVTVFTKNRERLLDSKLAQECLQAVVGDANDGGLLDREHFSVDGTLIEASANLSSYREKPNPPKPGQGTGRRGKLLKRDRYESRTDPEANLYRKSKTQPYRLSYLGHATMDHKHGLLVASMATRATTMAEREAAQAMLGKVRKWAGELAGEAAGKPQQLTVSADTAYHQKDFVESMREMNITPHLPAWKKGKKPDLIGAAMREQEEYRVSYGKRRWIERCFGWMKGAAVAAKTRFRGLRRVEWEFDFLMGAYNVLRMAKLRA
jgi:transposase